MAEVHTLPGIDLPGPQADLVAEAEALLALIKEGKVIRFIGVACFLGGDFRPIRGGSLSTSEALGFLDLAMHQIRQEHDDDQDQQ